MTVDYAAARELFLATLEQAPDDRDAFLKLHSRDNLALMAEVRSLLAFHHDEADSGTQLAPLQVGERYADRYRILRQVGRGGMGDVYHVHDEVLDESVGLKRLAGQTEALRGTLLNEVRLARRITHPRICRVYDVGEWHGEHFITMEFVEGEDLGRLIRRVGRLPSERVAEMAHELCVGLAAAHGKGVLHRDLKPANILVDADGHIHITDFGIAALAGARGAAALTGTPSYMAPEQLVPGGNSSERSDIYALGLVLHEMLTGKPVFTGIGLTEVLVSRGDITPLPPSQFVADIAPELDRAVWQSLRSDPRERPGSALEFAALLPGGDALLAAVEANTTPSPDLVAQASPGPGRLASSRSIPKLITLALILVVTIVLADSLALFPLPPNATHPAVNVDRAVELIHQLGYERSEGARSFYGYIEDPTATTAETSPLFWYREDRDPHRTSFQRMILDPTAEFTLFAPSTGVERDRLITVFGPDGELIYFQGSPGETSNATGVNSTDWSGLLAAVGMDDAGLTSAPPELPPMFASERAAWLSGDPDDSSSRYRINAAAVDGQLVYYSRRPESGEVIPPLDARLAGTNAVPLIIIVILAPIFLVAAIVLLVRNIRARRFDGPGTLKLAGVVAALSLVESLLVADHIYHPLSDYSEILRSSLMSFSGAAFGVALFYVALEPTVRHAWPQTLVAWTRVLHHDLRGAVVGRAVLIGTIAGSLCAMIYVADLAIPRLIDRVEALSLDHAPRLFAVLGVRETVSRLFGNAGSAISSGVVMLFVFTMLRSWLKRPAVSTAAFVLFFALLAGGVGRHHDLSVLTMGVPLGIVTAWVLARAGLLAYVVTAFVFASLRYAPITLDLDAWWASTGFATVGVVFLVGVLGAWMATRATETRVGRGHLGGTSLPTSIRG